MDRDSVEVFLPDPDDCYERLRRARFGATVSCVYCGEREPVIKKGTTGKGAQQYRCKECETYFNDLTDSFFEHRKFLIEEMFYMIKEIRSVSTAQIASDRERDYEAVLNFRHDLQELCGELNGLTLSDVCEADEIYVTAGEKGIEKEDEDESPRERGVKKGARNLRVGQTAGRDTRPSLRRTSGISGSREFSGRRRGDRRER